MIYYEEYADVPAEIVDAFVRAQELGRLLSVSADGIPHIGLYPFVHDGGAIEMHLHRSDEQLADLERARRCVFELDDVLAVIPSHWIHPEDAIFATAYHRTVVFECEAEIFTQGAAIAEQQMRLMARYQPEGGFRPLAPEDPLYLGNLSRIAAIRLHIVSRRVKFKIGQNRPADVRARVAGLLRKRGRASDERAADALQWTLDEEQRRRR